MSSFFKRISKKKKKVKKFKKNVLLGVWLNDKGLLHYFDVFVASGCTKPEDILAIPRDDFIKMRMNETDDIGEIYQKIHTLGGDWQILIKEKSFFNGMIRLQLSNSNFFSLYRQYLDKLLFRLEYKKEAAAEWKSFCFDYKQIGFQPDFHLNIRVSTNLFDYKMQFRLNVRFDDDYVERMHIFGHSFAAKVWYYCSESVCIHIPSSMKDAGFEKNEWVKFMRPNQKRRSYGTIMEMKRVKDGIWVYDVAYFRNSKIYKIKANEEGYFDNFALIKHLAAHSFIDLTEICEMEKELLIGDRMNVDNEYVMKLYALLNDIFYRDYALPYMKYIDYDERSVHSISTAKCVAFNVINCLWRKQNGYKLKCLLSENDSDHYEHTMKMTPQREYACGTGSPVGIIYYCDLCFCVQGDWYWMYRCQKEKNSMKGHDICLNCIHGVVQKSKQLKGLLDEMLADDLTNDCIHSIVVYTVGNVVKL